MQPRPNVSLRDYSTMRLGGNAAYLLDITSRIELQQALAWAGQQSMPVVMVGGGSNIVWRDEGFPGLVLVNKIMRYENFDEDGANHYITVGAGEAWDSVVERTVAAGLTGIEALSLIPGSAGATPVQNVGAYGQEIAQTLVSVEAYDSVDQTFLTIPGMECGFGYRTSRFKTTDKGRYYITALTLHLTRGNPEPPFYPSVQAYFDKQHVTSVTPQTLRQAVINIRTRKLPDPAVAANCGSYFENPIIAPGLFGRISDRYSDVPHWATADGKIKIGAAWLMEQAGFRDTHDTATGMATWPASTLVLVNEHADSTAALLAFQQKITDAVHAKFGIKLEREPELLP